MYEFTDTTEKPSAASLPAEALSINGVYIENQITGYRTLSVSGRELLGSEITTEEVGRRNGTVYRNRRYPERTITVTYQLIASSNAAFRRAFEKLNSILNVEQAQLIFADDPGYYFTGTPGEAGEIEPGMNNVVGTFSIICTDPFKRSVGLTTVNANSDGEFTINYGGNFPSYPILEVDFYKSATKNNKDGECGFVSFANEDARMLQFGVDVDKDDVIEKAQVVKETTNIVTKSEILLSHPMNDTEFWVANTGYTTKNGTNKKVGTLKADKLSTNGTDLGLQANSYGSGAGVYHGPTATLTLGKDSQGVTEHEDWRFQCELRFACSATTKTANAQKGSFQAFILDASNNPIAGIQVWKGSSGTTKGSARAYVASKGSSDASTVNTWENVDLSHYNSNFGFREKTTDVRTNGVAIGKSGSTLTFKIGNMNYSCTTNNTAKAAKICMYFAQYGTADPITRLGVYSCIFWSDSVKESVTSQTVETVINTIEQVKSFGTNDILIADCNSASVYVKNAYGSDETTGTPRPDLGALGNDWETFCLKPGTNKIGTFYSDWVSSTYKPTFKISYREVFL